MIILGLTGSIGMGKTTAAMMLKRMGCAIHDSDRSVHSALSPNGAAFEAVALNFPAAWDKKTHTIKRNILADIIFNDAEKKRILENILHPIVENNQKKFIQKEKRMERSFIVLDIPLLFETGAQNKVDYTVVVSAPCHVQRIRVLRRAGMTEEKFQTILKAQWPDIKKRACADFVIPTGIGMAYTHSRLKNMLEELKSIK